MHDSSATIAETLAGFVTGLDCASIPEAIRAQAKLHQLDSVGIALASAGFEFARKACAGLDAARLTMAQGIAYSTAAGNREFSAADSWTKRLEAGWPGVGGITAAMLAKEGFVGPRTPYEGKFGVFNVYLNTPAAASNVAAITAGLGADWEFAHILLKMRP